VYIGICWFITICSYKSCDFLPNIFLHSWKSSFVGFTFQQSPIYICTPMILLRVFSFTSLVYYYCIHYIVQLSVVSAIIMNFLCVLLFYIIFYFHWNALGYCGIFKGVRIRGTALLLLDGGFSAWLHMLEDKETRLWRGILQNKSITLSLGIA